MTAIQLPCDRCGNTITSDVHTPHEPDCPGEDCVCDTWICFACCWECNPSDDGSGSRPPTGPVVSSFDWRGERRDGAGSVGRLSADADVVEFVETKYRQRYRWLTVDADGVEVGGIVAHPDTGKRIWWADGDARPTTTSQTNRSAPVAAEPAPGR